MALALPDDGEIVTWDVSERWSFVARRFWEQAGVEKKISLHLRPALETLDELLQYDEAGRFDFAFIDADKENYQSYYESCLKLIKPGGLIVIGNLLWGGSVIDDDNHTDATEAIRRFNNSLKDDQRVDLVMLPIADGVSLAVKR